MEPNRTLNTQLLHELRLEREPSLAAQPRRHSALLVAGALGFGLALRPAQVAQHVPLAPAGATAVPGASALDASGYITARRVSIVSFKSTGRIREMLMQEGQSVSAGQILATLDPVDANAALQLARAQAASARSQFDSVTVQVRQSELDLRRADDLAARQFVSRAQSEQARAQCDLLRMQAATAHNNVEVADRQVRIAANALEDTRLRAPFHATVILQSAQVGEIVSPLTAGGGAIRTGVATLVDMTSLEIEVDVNAAHISRIHTDMRAQAVLDSYPDWPIAASVLSIAPGAQRSSGTIRVHLAIHSDDPRLRPDMGVKVSFREDVPLASPPVRTGVAALRSAGRPVPPAP